MRAQIFRMEVKIRAFLDAGMRGGEVMGRNSATGSPRRSITIIPPSEASRTNSEVWMWSSRTEVFLIKLHRSTWAVGAIRAHRRRLSRVGAQSGHVSNSAREPKVTSEWRVKREQSVKHVDSRVRNSDKPAGEMEVRTDREELTVAHDRAQLRIACRRIDKRRQSGRPG